MITVRKQERVGVDMAVALDPRTFHLFTEGGLLFFYSVEKGVLLELNQASYELLELCGRMSWDAVDAEMARRNPAWSPGDARAVLESLLCEDLFHFVPFDPEEQMAFLDRL